MYLETIDINKEVSGYYKLNLSFICEGFPSEYQSYLGRNVDIVDGDLMAEQTEEIAENIEKEETIETPPKPITTSCLDYMEIDLSG